MLFVRDVGIMKLIGSFAKQELLMSLRQGYIHAQNAGIDGENIKDIGIYKMNYLDLLE